MALAAPSCGLVLTAGSGEKLLNQGAEGLRGAFLGRRRRILRDISDSPPGLAGTRDSRSPGYAAARRRGLWGQESLGHCVYSSLGARGTKNSWGLAPEPTPPGCRAGGGTGISPRAVGREPPPLEGVTFRLWPLSGQWETRYWS